MIRLLSVFFMMLLAGSLSAQYNLGFSDSPPGLVFEINGEEKTSGAIGGFNTPQFSEIDLDFDGVLDLFVFDRQNDVIRTYVFNTSTDKYVYAPEYERSFPDNLKEFVLLRDYDCDGHMDIFTYFVAGFRVFRNNGTSTLGFTLVTDKIRSDYGSITTGAFVLAGDVPAIVDVDNDGDLDILTFGTVNSENTIEYHRNLSQELYSSCDSLEFEVVTQCWGNVEEPPNSAVLEPISCKGVVPPPGLHERGGMHPGSSVLLIDMDNDDDKDLIIGDIQTDRALLAINAGDATTASIDVNQQTNDFPNAQDPVMMQYLVAGYKIDADHDGQMDLIMSINNTLDSSANVEHIWYYRNTSSGAPNYVLEQTDFLLDDMLDIGSHTSPISMDVNGDGDMDILIANDFRRTPAGSSTSKIFYFEQDPSGQFILEDDDFAGLSNFGFQAATLALGDMDDDGDEDLMLGDLDGHLHLFENDPVGSMASFSLSEPIYQGINSIGSNAAPEIVDVNGDGLLDLLVGERIGTIAYFENTGTAQSADFATEPTIDPFGKIDVSEACCVGHAQPRWIDNPALANGKHLMVGSDEKTIRFYQIPNNLEDSFAMVDSVIVNAGRLSPQFVDLEQDGVYDLLTGTAEGGVRYLTREENVLIGLEQPSRLSVEPPVVYPNPASEKINIALPYSMNADVSLRTIDGSLIKYVVIDRSKSFALDMGSLPPGIYLLMIHGEAYLSTSRVMIAPLR